MDLKATPTGRPRARRVGARYGATVVAVVLGLAVLLPTVAQAAALCGCTRTGGYVNPAITAPEKSELSPGGGTYRLQAVEQTAIDVKLKVTNASTGATVKLLQLPLARLDWGFSPDGTTLMYRHAFVDAEGASPQLDVVGFWSLDGNRSLYHQNVNAGADTSFSPHGRYFTLHILRGQGWSEIVVKDATTGTTVHYDELMFANVPGYPGDEYGTTGLGFSPDDDDRTFVRAYRDRNGQVQLLAKNLETKQNVMSTVVSPDSWWKFSRCGDVFGLVTQPDQVSIAVSMRKTADGTALGATKWLPTSDSVRLESTLESHRIIDVTPNNGEQVIVVGANDADQPCSVPVALSQLTIAPTSVTGGQTHPTGTVTLTGTTTTALTVALASSDSAAATVPASVTVPAGSSSATFPITSKSVTSDRTVSVTATAGTVTTSASLAVKAVPVSPLDTIGVAPARIVAGTTGSTGTVTLSTPAGPSGSVVTLTSSSPALASVPSSVTVAAGQVTATFPITTSAAAVRVDAPVRITAVGGGITRTTTLWILTADRDCEAGTADPGRETVKLRSFASYDDAGTNADCIQAQTFRNGITVGAGSTGLPVGSPVTLELTTRFDGSLLSSPPLGSGGVTADGTSTYSIIDDSVPDTGEGATEPVTFRADYNLQHYGIGAAVYKTSDLSLRTNVGTPLSVDTYEEATSADAHIWDVDTGTLTAQYTTTVGAHLTINARVSTVASAYGSGATAISDFSNTFTASTTPADGFEGLALTYDVGGPQPPANQAPTCTAAPVSTTEDAAVAGTVTCSDPEGAALTRSVVTTPAHGTVSAIDAQGRFTYTPAANWSGTDSFTVKANDGKADSTPVTVTVTVTPVNDAPVCTNRTGTTDAGKALTGTVACTDVEGDALTYSVTAAPAKGKVTVTAKTGAFTYTPNAGFSGTDSFKVQASDGKAVAAATVDVTVKAPVSVGPPTRLDQCLNNGWKQFNNPTFSSQTTCLVWTLLHLIFG